MHKYLKIMLFLAIVGLILFTRFYHLAEPTEVVFDEVHFGKFFSAYLKHTYFFDIHPPLGKLIFALTGYLADFKPVFDFEKIGEPYPDSSFIWLRFVTAIFGSLLPIIIFFILRQLGFSFLISILGMILITLENSLIVQSRYILMDSFMLVFGFSSFLFYLKSVKKKNKLYLFLCSIFSGLTYSIKWTGLGFFAAISVFAFFKCHNSKQFLKQMLIIFLISFIIYTSLFVVHFKLIRQSIFASDYKDSSFISKISKLSYDIAKLNFQMFGSNLTLTETHPYSSKWYQWPLGDKPIFYWQKENLGIYLNPNLILWFLMLASLFFSFVEFLFLSSKVLLGKNLNLADKRHFNFLGVFLFIYLFNWLPFIFIKRVMFLYHYFPALIFSLIIFCLQINRLYVRIPDRFKTLFIISIIGLTLSGFLFFLPKTYGY